MDCIFEYGCSRKHVYTEYRTWLLRRKKYCCKQCGRRITAFDYQNYKEMWRKRDAIVAKIN